MTHLASWNEERSAEGTLETLKRLAKPLIERLSPRFAQIGEFVSSESWNELVNFEVPYQDPSVTVNEIIVVRQILGLFSKYENLPLGVDKEAVAWEKFKEAETVCEKMNCVFSALNAGRSVESGHQLEPFISELFRARSLVRRVMGRKPSLEGLKFTHGPGATTSIKKSMSSAASKFWGGFQCSERLAFSGYLQPLLAEVPHWCSALPSTEETEDKYVVTVEVATGRLQFVPKNAKTYRSIIVEPVLNAFGQQGIRKYLEKRLALHGLVITDQSLSRTRARLGSITGAYATLDLSSASDTISRGLVKFLLDPDWYYLMSSFTTPDITYSSKQGLVSLHQHKFCSMGNAFTFPLETLIFWALSVAVCGPDCTVYGDDIIVPVGSVERLIEVLEACGFTVNLAKSFLEGPFRESCGADYYKGIDVRPAYVKHNVSPRSLTSLHNFFARNLDDEMSSAIKQEIPRHLRLYGPDGYGDGHLISDRYEKRITAQLLRRGYSGHFFTTFVAKGRFIKCRFPGDWVSPLYSVYIRQGEETPIKTDANGFPLWGCPGADVYVKKSIYTFG